MNLRAGDLVLIDLYRYLPLFIVVILATLVLNKQT